jgi:hypothetical protein
MGRRGDNFLDRDGFGFDDSGRPGREELGIGGTGLWSKDVMGS